MDYKAFKSFDEIDEYDKAILDNIHDKKKIEEVKGDYDKIEINSIIPIINQRRYCKNIVDFKKIIEFLNQSGVPYILFYVGEEVNNRVENCLLNHIKNSKNIIYESLMLKIQEKENKLIANINQSFIIRNICQNLKKINKDEIFDIINNINLTIPKTKIDNYYNFLYDSLIEIKQNTEHKYEVLAFVIIDKIPEKYKKLIDNINSLNSFIYIHLILTNKKNLLNDYKPFKEKKILNKFIFSDEKEVLEDKILKYNLDFEVRNINKIGLINWKENISNKIREILNNYIFSNYSHFNEQVYLNIENLHQKIMFDI